MLKTYETTNYYEHLSQQMWMTIVFWSVQIKVRGKESGVDEMLESVWMQIKPHMTGRGDLDFKSINKNISIVV